MGDSINQRWAKLSEGDIVARYTRRALKTRGRSGDEYRWPRAEENERAFFHSRKKQIGITIAKRNDGTLCLIPLDRNIKDVKKVKEYFEEQGYSR